MNCRVTFEPLEAGAPPPPDLQAMRAQHLQGLPEPLSPMLDILVGDGVRVRVLHGEQACGYLALSAAGDCLLELWLQPSHWVFGEVIVRQAVRALGLRRALVQQYDALLLSSCMPLQDQVQCAGLLVRDFVPRDLPQLRGLSFTSRTAVEADLAAVRAVDQQVFTHPERLAGVIAAGDMQLYEREGALIGFGIMRPIGPDRSSVELGIAVDRPFRSRGYAVYMLRAMIDACLARGLRPVSSCAQDNHASRNMGERAGFVSRYRLLELRFAPGESQPSARS